MTFNPTPEEQAQKLRAAECAAGSAMGWGCSPNDIRAAVEAGIADYLNDQEQLRAVRAGEPAEQPPPSKGWTPAATPALDAWAAQVAQAAQAAR